MLSIKFFALTDYFYHSIHSQGGGTKQPSKADHLTSLALQAKV